MKRLTATLCFHLGVVAMLAGNPASGQTNRVVNPPIPTLKSPVDSFRALLVMPKVEQRQFIASRNTNVQERLVAKIREYQTLTPEERELRLKATELRWYLQPLLRSPATNRADQLLLIPEDLRPMVADRLAQWDRIPTPVQQMFLTNEQAAGYLARVDAPTGLPPHPARQIHQRMAARINQLFDLTPAEKEEVLATLSDAERRQMQKTWEAFTKLTVPQRRQVLLSLKQFSDLTPIQQTEFLQNAERWSQMTPAQRQAWRELVSAASRMPPVPKLKLPLPPPNPAHRKPGASVATNGG